MLYIRPFKKSDSAKVISWIHDEATFYQWSEGLLGSYPPPEDLLEQYQKDTEEDDTIFPMVACDQNGPFGYMIIQFTDASRKELRFRFILVDDTKQGLGYGKLMLDKAMGFVFHGIGAKKLSLNVFENNLTAISCYVAAGFKEVTTEEPIIYNIMGQEWRCKRYEMSEFTVGQNNGLTTNVSDEETLKTIMDTNSIQYAFQPIVSATSGDIYGYEALMRPGLGGPVSPMALLEYATKNNRLYEIEKSTFGNVLHIVSHNRKLFGDRKVFINSIPGYLLTEFDFTELADKYTDILGQVICEITEAAELNDKELMTLLDRSKSRGFELAIDDYGTGYSNTANLLRCLPNCVKIDRLLISNIHQDQKKQHFVRSMIEFAQGNGFMTLAEGVETFAELKTVIELGVDLIQGFYTARPSLEILPEIEPEIRNEIINANVRGQTQSTRKIFVVDQEDEVPLMRVALEQNTGILVTKPKFTIVGNPNYTAAMNVKIKDGLTCNLTLRDVFLECFQDLPCIELGENVHLTIRLEGTNALRKVGICVPESSSVRIEGPGDLIIHVKGILSYGIGNTREASVGDIHWFGRGKLDVLVEADDAIAIGGGHFKGTDGIRVCYGKVHIELASATAIGIGCAEGNPQILIKDTDLDLVLNVSEGIGIGCRKDNIDVKVISSTVSIGGAGSYLSGIGCNGEAQFNLLVDDSKVNVSMNGQKIHLLGTDNGEAKIMLNESCLNLRGEGSEVMGIGSRYGKGKIRGTDTDCILKIKSGGYKLFGAPEDKVTFYGGVQELVANE